MAEKWIQEAIKHPRAFSEKAKKAGMTTREYARYVLRRGSRADTRTKKQANLALTLMKIRRKRRG